MGDKSPLAPSASSAMESSSGSSESSSPISSSSSSSESGAVMPDLSLLGISSSSSSHKWWRDDPTFDGVDLEDDLLLLRTQMQDRLLTNRRDHRRILVTAPPASGKTSMIELLVQRIRNENLGSVLHITATDAPRFAEDGDITDHQEQLRKWLRREVRDESDKKAQSLKNAMKHYDYILIDDAHKLYPVEEIIDGVIKSSKAAHVIFFASTSGIGRDASTPAFPTRVTWNEFRLTPEEVEQLCKRMIARVGTDQQEWAPTLIRKLCEDAEGHIGLIRLLAYTLFHELRPMYNTPNTTLASAMNFYMGAMFDQRITERFFTKPINDSQRMVVERLLLGQQVFAPPVFSSPADESEHTRTLRALVRQAIVVDTAPDAAGISYLQFASPLHFRFFMRKLYPSAILSSQEEWLKLEVDIDAWVLKVLSTFQPLHLNNPSSHGTSDHFPKEGPLQHQFWRGASMCLPHEFRLAAEVSSVQQADGSIIKIKGELDFWINSKLCWAIELLRCGHLKGGNLKGGHLKRFKEKGAYADLKPKQWRVIDFRPHGQIPHREEGYIAVIFNKDMTGAWVQIGTEKKHDQEVVFKSS